MTNEQTALLLRQIAQRIRQLSKDIKPFIKEGGRETIPVWVGEGEKPSLAFQFGKDWENRPDGEFTAVAMVEDLANDLEEEAKLL